VHLVQTGKSTIDVDRCFWMRVGSRPKYGVPSVISYHQGQCVVMLSLYTVMCLKQIAPYRLNHITNIGRYAATNDCHRLICVFEYGYRETRANFTKSCARSHPCIQTDNEKNQTIEKKSARSHKAPGRYNSMTSIRARSGPT
jgi:hypothetical protein